MKNYPPTAISDDAWKAVEFIFMKDDLPCLPKGSSGDGFSPKTIETTKRGFEIDGTMSFMKGGHDGGFLDHPLHLCLAKPLFSSTESVTSKKIDEAKISEAYFDGDVLCVTVG